MCRLGADQKPASGRRDRSGWTRTRDRFSGAAVGVKGGGGGFARERRGGDGAAGGPAGAGGERNEDGSGESRSYFEGSAGFGIHKRFFRAQPEIVPIYAVY